MGILTEMVDAEAEIRRLRTMIGDLTDTLTVARQEIVDLAEPILGNTTLQHVAYIDRAIERGRREK